MADILKKQKTAISLQRFVWSAQSLAVKILKFKKSKMADGRQFKNS